MDICVSARLYEQSPGLRCWSEKCLLFVVHALDAEVFDVVCDTKDIGFLQANLNNILQSNCKTKRVYHSSKSTKFCHAL
jgi:hypothetical protein